MKYILYLLLFSLSITTHAQNLELVENKGQWPQQVMLKGALLTGAFFLEPQGYKIVQHNADDLNAINAKVHGGLYAQTKGNDKYFSNENFPSDISKSIIRSHAYEVTFAQSNPHPQIVYEKQQPGYNNYFLGDDKSKWAGNCKIFGAVTYKNVYSGIDVRYYSDNGKLKYDIIVNANADISKIALNYQGIDGMEIRGGDLYVKTSVGEVKEQYPYSYQPNANGRSSVDCKFKISGSTLKYQIGDYDKSKTLVIDPTLVFASLTGPANNWGYSATYGPGGTMFGGGISLGTSFPVSNGAFQTTYGGGDNSTGEGSNTGYDIAIIKLSADGSQRVYATYVGGAGNEAPHSMITDNQGNLIVAGRTRSANFPTTTAPIGPQGGWDIVIFKLNAAGSALIGSLKIGGSGDDGVNIRNKYSGPGPEPESLMINYGDDSRSEVIFDNNGNLLLASCSQSANFPVVAGTAFQPTIMGKQDGLLLRFNANLTTMTYASFIGGTEDDAAYVLNVSPLTGDIYIGGATLSTNFPGNKAGTLGPNSAGNIDGFVAIVSNAGALIKSTFISTPGIDEVYGLKFDIFGFPYIMGTTTGNFPIQNAAFSQPGGKQFIGKLEKDLSAYVYSTVFGTNSTVPNISPLAFLVDRCENVYISGWGGPITSSPLVPFANAGTIGLSVTSDAIQSTTDGKDIYFFVLEKNAASQLYGSFFGQSGGFTDHVDGGTSRFDENGIIYQAICANCGGRTTATFPTTPGVWATENGGTGCNEGLVKVEFNLAGIKSGVKTSILAQDGDTSGCVPLTIDFRDTVALAKGYIWNFGDGTANFTTLTANLSHTFTSVGTYRVRLIAIDSTKCFPRDTSFVNVRIRADVATLNATAVKLPPCQSTTYRFTNNSIPFAGKSFTNQSFRWIWGDNTADVITGLNSIDHVYPGVGTFNVKLVLEDTNFCNAPDTFRITVRISPNVKASFTSPASGCSPYNAAFMNTSLGGTDFVWDFGDGSPISTDVNPTHLYPTPGIYVIRLVATDISTCNLIDSVSFTVTVSGKPTAAFTYSPNPATENSTTTFTNNSLGAARYRWYYGDGDSLYTFKKDTTVRHTYNETKQFNPCLVAINQFNCPDTTCQILDALVVSLLDVPNAFTPNGDGVNDRAIVIGFGITKLSFKIYNRWGQLVFETSDRTKGWDGRFKGKAQPMDVYAYTLEADFFDGKKATKKGDITLLR